MKILFISHSNDLSGANKSLLDIIINLQSRIDIVVMCNSKNGALTDALSKLHIKVIIADYAWWYISPRKNLLKQLYRAFVDSKNYKIKKLNKEILESLFIENFDLVYTNTSTVDVGAHISKELSIPHVWHIREFGEEDFGFIPIVPKEKQMETFMSANKIIVNSNALGNKYRNYIPADKVKVIYNGFDIKKIESAHTKTASFSTRILITGQVCEGKGQKQAILAVARLRNKGENIHLFLAGTVNKSYLKSIYTQIGGEKEWLHILGQCSDMKKIRADMDIELVCSKCEAFGRVTIEAMLNGIPVIGSNSGGTPELIRDHRTGLLYENGNIEQLSNCISELINDQELYTAISNNARKFARGFTISNTVNEIYNVFYDIIYPL